MSNNLNECDDAFWNGSILGYWLKYTHTRKELLLICRVVSRFTSVRVGILQHRENLIIFMKSLYSLWVMININDR